MDHLTRGSVLGLLVALCYSVYFIILIARIPRSVRSVAAQLDRMNAALERCFPPSSSPSPSQSPSLSVEPMTREDVEARLTALDVRRAGGFLSEDEYAFQRRQLEARLPTS